jgi:nucleoside 2-deoxyribosyltransferase
MSKRIYVAGAWIHREDAQKKMEELTKLGFFITSNWVTRENGVNNPGDYRICAKMDFDEIDAADTVLAIMTDNQYPFRGAFTEIGYGIGRGKRVIIFSDGVCVKKVMDNVNVDFSHACMKNVFFFHSAVEHASTFEDAIKLLKGETVPSPFKEFYDN